MPAMKVPAAWQIAAPAFKMIPGWAEKPALRWRDVLGLAVMILGLVLFFGIHLLTTQRDLRGRLVRRVGRGRRSSATGLFRWLAWR